MTLFERIVGDENDLDQFGMDAMTRKRLKVKNKMARVKRKPMRSLPTKLPRQLADIEEGRWFSTLGAKGKGINDPVGYVTSQFFNSTKELERSVVDIQKNRNGWIIQGSWPSSGPQVFDWELETWGERGGAVVVHFRMWSGKGTEGGQNYRTTVATVNKLVPKFLKKVFIPTKAEMKREVGAKIGMREALEESIHLMDVAIERLAESSAVTIMPSASSSKLRREVSAKDIRIRPGDITKETQIVPENRLSIVARVPKTGMDYVVKTQWFARDTVIDMRRIQTVVRVALSKYLSTGKGLRKGQDGSLVL